MIERKINLLAQGCALSKKAIKAYEFGLLHKPDNKDLVSHLKGCEDCRRALSLYRGLVQFLGDTSEEKVESTEISEFFKRLGGNTPDAGKLHIGKYS
jgi:hypothetical protein